MNATETAPGPTLDDGRRRNTSRRSVAVAAVMLVAVGLGLWSWATRPRLEGGGVAGVSSPDHEIVWARGLDETIYVVPANEPGSSTIAFGIRNAGPLAVELVEVWPNDDDPGCFWQPSDRWFQDDPRYQGVLDDRARPAAGAVLAPGRSATVWITGSFLDPAGCVWGALSTHEDVEVIVRIAGRTSSTRVPLGYLFGYADDPEMLGEFYDLGVWPPTPPSTGG